MYKNDLSLIQAIKIAFTDQADVAKAQYDANECVNV